MRSPSLDIVYSQLHKHVLLAQSYTEIEELSFIIKSCRLKPYDYVFEKKDDKLILHRHWFDEFGNSFKIDKNKRIEIVYNDLSLARDKIICTDLYYGLSLNKVAKLSKLVHIFYGKDEDMLEDCCTLTFLGMDNYLRSYLYLYGEWQTISPLFIGIKNLKNIGNHVDIKHFIEFSNKENMPVPCIASKEWLTFMPVSESFISTIKKQCEMLSPIFKEENIHGS